MARDKREQYGSDIDSWLGGPGGQLIAAIAVLLVVWGAVVVFS